MVTSPNVRGLRALPYALLGLTLAIGPDTASADRVGPVNAPVPPNILFIVDASSSMGDCFLNEMKDTDGDNVGDTCRGGSKLGAVQRVLMDAVRSAPGARYAVAQTDPSSAYTGIGTRPAFLSSQATITRAGIMSPIGDPRWNFDSALASITLNEDDAASLAESLRDGLLYLAKGIYGCTDSTLCADTPWDYSDCQENYIIVLTDGTSGGAYSVDNALYASFKPSITPDVNVTNNKDMDNISYFLADSSRTSFLVGDIPVKTYVVGLDVTNYFDDQLFENVAYQAGTAYLEADTVDSLKGAVSTILNDITAGSYQELPPVISSIMEDSWRSDYSDGLDYRVQSILVGWYNAVDNTPLNRGHLSSYTVDADPSSSTYGDVLTGAVYDWSAGLKLSTRSVSSGEARETSNGNNGEGIRDIFTNINQDASPDAFDSSNVSALCPLMLDTTAGAASPAYSPGAMKGHDIDGDGDVDTIDCQALIDFIRGNVTSDFLSTGQLRGAWKLGSILTSSPVVVSPEPHIFSRNQTLREFQSTILAQKLLNCPTAPKPCDASVAFVTANDGMLHAFNASTGEELWAYIPRPLLGETIPDYIEGGTLLDLMWGERVTFDASPTVSFVWIDGYQGAGVIGTADGVQSADEWIRVLQVGMGAGGRYTLGMDITQPDQPYILWEDTSTDALIGFGATTSNPGSALILDGSHPTYVSIYGSGLELDGYTESRLYIRAMEDFQGMSETYSDTGLSLFVDLNGDNAHDGSGLNSDPTLVDRNSDGLTDEVYIANSGGVLTKTVIDTSDIDASAPCIFFDPETDLTTSINGLSPDRVPAQFSATAAYSGSGDLLIYWGTGSPYEPLVEGRGGMYILESGAGCHRAVPLSTCTINGTDGYIPFEVGERMTGAPIVFDGVLYFSTFAPSDNRCGDGEARLYGVDYVDCSATFDTDPLSDNDDLYISLGKGTASGPVIANGSVYVAITNPDDPSGDPSLVRQTIGSTLSSATAIQFRERF